MSNGRQNSGRAPCTGASEPTQNMAAARPPCSRTLVHSGLPSSHQRSSPTVAGSNMLKRTPGMAGSVMKLAITPWWSGRSPVTSV